MLIVAEMGINHNGDVDLARPLRSMPPPRRRRKRRQVPEADGQSCLFR